MKKKKQKKVKITSASIIGMIFGLMIIGAGLHICIVTDKYAGYPTVGLGLCLMVLIAIVSRGKAK